VPVSRTDSGGQVTRRQSRPTLQQPLFRDDWTDSESEPVITAATAQARMSLPGLPVNVQVYTGMCRYVPVSVSKSISSFHNFDYLMQVYSWFAPGLSFSAQLIVTPR
jgi:hypothetical protein